MFCISVFFPAKRLAQRLLEAKLRVKDAAVVIWCLVHCIHRAIRIPGVFLSIDLSSDQLISFEVSHWVGLNVDGSR